jgi:hypothetical protein
MLQKVDLGVAKNMFHLIKVTGNKDCHKIINCHRRPVNLQVHPNVPMYLRIDLMRRENLNIHFNYYKPGDLLVCYSFENKMPGKNKVGPKE